jgi:hypothetical protein
MPRRRGQSSILEHTCDKGLEFYEERHRQQQVHLLIKRAAKLGLQVVGPGPA